ncbi:RES domain-containing protein [uncultured Paracoccus sp.]|uniref:RES family NAD+ phosphorylase n=1 Tax=uncultured Paracoccus sp. TaxID=189685 RepID=UPI002601C0D2|nr:RES domain-containing protein [uncultured Paracoccus sp.]
MNTLPVPLGSGELRLWRLDHQRYAGTWASGAGSFRVGGRWSSKGLPVVYCAIDPAVAILEVAVHKGFEVLDTEPHVLTSARVDAAMLYVVDAKALPNANWLRPGVPSAGQQLHGSRLLRAHDGILVPSVVSQHSWNLVFEARLGGLPLDDIQQEPFALDPRLHPPAS